METPVARGPEAHRDETDHSAVDELKRLGLWIDEETGITLGQWKRCIHLRKWIAERLDLDMPYQFFTSKFNAQLVTFWLLMDEEVRCKLRTYVLTLRLKE